MPHTHRAIVIKPDGTVPFDADLADEHRQMMIADLVEMGHTVEHHARPHPVHGGGSHLVLLTGPHCKASQEARRAIEAKNAAATAGELNLKPGKA